MKKPYLRVDISAFITPDEIDGLLGYRDRNIETQIVCPTFLQAWGGFENRVVYLVGATNRPELLDPAARDRFTSELRLPALDAEDVQAVFLHQCQENGKSLLATDDPEAFVRDFLDVILGRNRWFSSRRKQPYKVSLDRPRRIEAFGESVAVTRGTAGQLMNAFSQAGEGRSAEPKEAGGPSQSDRAKENNQG